MELEVELVAHTAFYEHTAAAVTGYQPHDGFAVEEVDELAEFAGRNCYQSWDRPNPKTATNQGYLANILKQNHESVLEHASATFYVDGVSRALLAELTRHRHLSFSVISQRYVDAEELGTVLPPGIHRLEGMDWPIAQGIYEEAYDKALDAYAALVNIYEGAGMPNKEAREAARFVLPNGTATPMVVTGNMRAWLDVLRKRWHVAADREIREFAGAVLSHLREIAPSTFQNVPEKPYGTKQ